MGGQMDEWMSEQKTSKQTNKQTNQTKPKQINQSENILVETISHKTISHNSPLLLQFRYFYIIRPNWALHVHNQI